MDTIKDVFEAHEDAIKNGYLHRAKMHIPVNNLILRVDFSFNIEGPEPEVGINGHEVEVMVHELLLDDYPYIDILPKMNRRDLLEIENILIEEVVESL